MKIFTKGRQDYWRRSTTQLQCSSRSTRRSAIYKEDGDYSMTASGSTRRPATTQLRRARGLVRPGATGYLTWHGSVLDMGWGCLIPIRHVTSRIDLELVGIEGNYSNSTRGRLLGSYGSRVPRNLASLAYIWAGKDPSRGGTEGRDA